MPRPPERNKPEAADGGGKLAPVSRWSGGDLGLHLIMSVLVVGAVGFALDRHFGSAPWGMLGGGALGFASWVWVAFRAMGRPR